MKENKKTIIPLCFSVSSVAKKTKRTHFSHFSANFEDHQNMYTCILAYLFRQNEPIPPRSWRPGADC